MSVARACFTAMLLSTCGSVAAQHFELGGGLTDEIEGKASHTFTAAWFIRDGDWPIELLVGHIAGRDDPDEFQSPEVNFAAVSLRRQWSHWFAGFGVALIDGQSEVLSSTHQFVSTGGYRLNDRFSVALRHLSNANTRGRNRGENLLTVNFQF